MDQMDFRGLFRIFLVLFYICGNILGTQSLEPPQFNRKRVVVEYGGSFSVNCSTEEKGVQMGLEAPHNPVHNVIATEITWNPKNVTEWDLKPICFITLSNDQLLTELNVVVYKPPDRVSISTRNSSEPLKEGQQYDLRCDVQDVAPVNLLTVNWYRGDVLLKSKTFNDRQEKKPVNVSDTITIVASRFDDGIKFRCETVLKLGPEGPQPPPTVTSEALSFNVHYPPMKILELENKQVNHDETVVLNCVFDAKPNPTYKWEYYDMPNVNYMSNSFGSLLNITKASRLNNGNYTCIASNDEGEERHTVRVDVRGAENFCLLSLSMSHVVLQYGQSVNVTCSAPKPVYWEYLNTKVESPDLVLNSVDLAKSDKQPSCHVTFNNDVKCVKDLNVTVYKYPDAVFITSETDGPMFAGTSYVLRCNIVNVLPVQLYTVTWYRGTTAVNSTSSESTFTAPRNVSSELQITHRKEDDGVQYTCAVDINLRSEEPQQSLTTSNPLNVTVYYKPAINTTKLPASALLFKGYPEMLVCEADGNPRPDIMWNTSDGIVLNQANITITDKGGYYTCIAENSAGRDERVVMVNLGSADCPLQLRPLALVVPYGGSASADCFTDVAHEGLAWMAPQEALEEQRGVQLISWRVERVLQWDLQLACVIRTHGRQCTLRLPVTVYKVPDRVSVSTLSHRGAMIEGRTYELQCDVHNVAPLQLLTINWYKEQYLVGKTTFADATMTPVNQSTRYLIDVRNTDDRVQYRCEAELQVKATGPHLKVSSQTIGISVHYPPRVSSVVEVVNQTAEDDVLNCTVPANPPPEYTWFSTNRELNVRLPVLALSALSSGNYTCMASNRIGSVSKMFIVQTKSKGSRQSVFWIIVGFFSGLAVLIIMGYVLQQRTGKN